MQRLGTASHQGQAVGHVEGVARSDSKAKGGTVRSNGSASHHLEVRKSKDKQSLFVKQENEKKNCFKVCQ